jgi:hypothetical protein
MKKIKTSIGFFLIGIAIVFSMSNESYAIGTISGTITDTSTLNVSDAFVAAFLDGLFVNSDVTSNNGLYCISNLDDNTYEIHVIANSYEYRVEKDVEVTDGNITTKDVTDIALEGKVTGTVTRSDKTAAFANVLVIAEQSSGLTFSAMTDSNGDYIIDKLPAGTYTVKGSKSDYGFTNRQNLEISPGQTISNIDLIGTNGKISGIVTQSGGSPVLESTLVGAKDSNSDIKVFGITDSNGNYELVGLATGSYTVFAKRGYGETIKVNNVSVTDGSTTRLNLSMSDSFTSDQDTPSEASGSIIGTITNTAREVISGAMVIAVDHSNPGRLCIPSTTDTNGNYTIDHLQTGKYTIYACADGYASSSVIDVSVIAGRATYINNLSLGTSGGTISGTIYGEDYTTPIRKAMVQCISEGKSLSSTLTDNNGRYSLKLLQAGVYKVFASAEGYDIEILDNVVVTESYENSDNDIKLCKKNY